MDFPRTRNRRVEISLIPLIDVSIFLLIFFMLAGTIEKFEMIPVEPPVAKSGKLMDEGHVVVMLGRHDEIILGDEIVEMEQMQQMLAPDLAKNPNKIVTVKADAEVPANRVVDLMEAIKKSGGKNLSIVTQSGELKIDAQ
ncbi:MAG: biopolymer transporter ExbD [Rickettsiales bacterium]|jgi:biopolymer transport protein ExbD|nr:biopolymer transporter ExbD [Rickettsiales bacterium]